MRIWKVTAKFGNDVLKFSLPAGVKQETLNEAYLSARSLAAKGFGLREHLTFPEALKVTVEESYED